jgi:hypothetical protein
MIIAGLVVSHPAGRASRLILLSTTGWDRGDFIIKLKPKGSQFFRMENPCLFTLPVQLPIKYKKISIK